MLDQAKEASSDENMVSRVFGGIVVAVLGLCWFASGGPQTSSSGSLPSPSPSRSHASADDGMAYIMAKKLVTAQLKAPSTARFPWTGYKATDLGGGRWRVSSYVDAQNGFGAMIRSQWTVEMEVTGATWKLVDCSID